MDSDIDDREPQQPPDVPPDELEEALKWLEEMTARQRGPADPNDLSPIAPIDSPFSGLIETEPGDVLPDWLRETPGPDESDQDEPESRLDWLGKMAERESVEEQTTVQWRYLGEADESATRDETETPLAESATQPLMALEPDDAAQDAPPATEAWETVADDTFEATNEPELTAPPIAAPEALPPVDDLDAAEAAMAWIEELVGSQDAPIEDVPSVADRALASKLMLEAGLSPDIFGLESAAVDFSLLEERTPINAFVEAEDLADTVVLVETLVADQGGEPEFTPDAPVLPVTVLPGAAAPDLGDEPLMAEEFVPPEVAGLVDETAEPLSFDEAMSLLDDMAPGAARGATRGAAPASELDTGALPGPDGMEAAPDETAGVEALDAGEAPWLTATVGATATEGAATVATAGDTHWDEDAVTQPLEPATFVEEPAVEEVYVEEWDQPAPPLSEVASEADELLPALIESDAEPLQAEPIVEAEVATGGTDAEWPDAIELTADNLEAPAPFDVAVVAASSQFVDTLEEDAPMSAIEPEPEYLAASNGLEATSALEATLRELDVLALPPGRTLGDVDMTLRRRGAVAPQRDLPAALAWLEAALVGPAEPPPPASPAILAPEPGLDETELLDRMPDDPDAALAWLERIAGEEGDVAMAAPASTAEPIASSQAARAALPAAPPSSDEVWTEDANLLDMPDDPDEVMAWLEGIAQGGSAKPVAATTATIPVASPVEAPQPVEAPAALAMPAPPAEQTAPAEAIAPVEMPASVEASAPVVAAPPVELSAEPLAVAPPAPGLRVNLRKRRFVIREGQPSAPAEGDAGWVDRLESRE
ncbi:hypothetical protein [Promineifilum sp.]|uniref:hypothetical protein n=1 Tax=Promineifilum sp. TaxID=2664178 RepID=UPI0035B2838E